MRIMRALAVEFRNYAQAMSYVCGFLMLTHDEVRCLPSIHMRASLVWSLGPFT